MKETKINLLDENIYSFTTKNKLNVYMWVNKDKSNVYMQLHVGYGSIDTEFKIDNVKYTVPSGTAHYLEHLKFNTSEGDVTALFSDLGCDSNAYTSTTETNYEVYANENINEACKLLLNFVYDDYFKKELVDKERGIIIEECNSSKDDPIYEYRKELLNNTYENSNYKVPVIGFEKDINKITLDDVSLVHNTFYRPENMSLFITGNFDPEELKKVIEENESERVFKKIGKVTRVYNHDKGKILKDEVIVDSDKVGNKRGCLTIKTPASKFKGYKLCDVVRAIEIMLYANFSPSSDFYEEIKLKDLVTSFTSNCYTNDDVVFTRFRYSSENVKEVESLIIEQLNKINITKSDLDRFNKQNKTFLTLHFDNIYSVGSTLNSIINDSRVEIDKFFEFYEDLTVTKIKEIFNLIDIDNRFVITLNPVEKKKRNNS